MRYNNRAVTDAQILTTLVAADGLTGGFLQDSQRATDAEARTASATDKVLTAANLAGRSAFKANKNGVDQTAIVSGTPTKITFPTEVFDRAGDFADSTYTPPAGAVELKARANLGGTISAGAVCYIAIYKNGSLFQISAPVHAVVANNVYAEVSAEDLANGTDTYEAWASIATSAGTGTVSGNITSTFFAGRQI